MRWIDVMSEVAFTVMDLQDRGRGDLGQRFLNAYLEITGDYAGLSVLRFYLAYRAMVRAMVARLRAVQLGAGDARRAVLAEYHGYVELAQSYARPPRPAIILTHGLAGSGKTTLSQALLEVWARYASAPMSSASACMGIGRTSDRQAASTAACMRQMRPRPHIVTYAPQPAASSLPAMSPSSMRRSSSAGNAICFASSRPDLQVPFVISDLHRAAKRRCATASRAVRPRGTMRRMRTWPCSTISCGCRNRSRRTSAQTRSPTIAKSRSNVPMHSVLARGGGADRNRKALQHRQRCACRRSRTGEQVAFLSLPTSYPEPIDDLASNTSTAPARLCVDARRASAAATSAT